MPEERRQEDGPKRRRFAEVLADFHAGKVKEVHAELQEILKRAPDHHPALHLFGVIQLQHGHIDAAIKAIEKAIVKDVSVADYYMNLAACWKLKSDSNKALWCYRRAIRIRPELAEAHHGAGMLLALLGDMDRARINLTTAVRLKGNWPRGHNDLANLLARMGRMDEAIEHYQRASDLAPDNPFPLINLGNALLVSGQYEKAEQPLTKAIELKPDSAEAHFNIGNVYLKTKRYDRALGSYTKSLQLRPNFPEAYENIGRLLDAIGKKKEAEECLERAARLRETQAA